MVCLQHQYTHQCRIRNNKQKKKKEKSKKSRDLSVEKMACSPPTTFKQQQHYYTGHHLRNNLATWASAQALVLSGQMQAHQPHPTGFFTHALIMSVATHTHIFFSHFSPIWLDVKHTVSQLPLFGTATGASWGLGRRCASLLIHETIMEVSVVVGQARPCLVASTTCWNIWTHTPL